MKKEIIVLGSTGSIGRATLEVIAEQSGKFEVTGLACKGSIDLLNQQIQRFNPRYVCVYDGPAKSQVRFDKKRVLTGINGIREMIAADGEIVVNALPGSTGLEPSIEALKSDKVLALANKESLVMAGRIVTRMVMENGAKLFPVDSEHSALFQLLRSSRRTDVENITITASGGPFRRHKKEALKSVSPEEALAHPTWEMGKKITLDSATLMNKGLEVIEAYWLFHIEPEKIRVVVHPESIIHGMVEFKDGAFLAYMAHPDMKIPISYAINQGRIKTLPFGKMRLEELSKLTFYPPDPDRFPSLRLAYEALSAGDSAQIALNASNEVVSDAFIGGKIRFTDIPRFIEKTLEEEPGITMIEDMETVLEVHQWAKRHTEDMLRE